MARRTRRRIYKATREDEYRLLLDNAPNEIYRDLIVIMRWGGLRVSEAVGLRWESVDLSALQMTVIGKGAVERIIDVLPEAERMLRRRAKNVDTGQVFPRGNGQPYTTRSVQRVLKALREELGIPPERGTPHKLRHRYATDSLEHGVPLHILRDQLGHADIATTSIYTHSAAGAGAALLRAGKRRRWRQNRRFGRPAAVEWGKLKGVPRDTARNGG